MILLTLQFFPKNNFPRLAKSTKSSTSNPKQKINFYTTWMNFHPSLKYNFCLFPPNTRIKWAQISIKIPFSYLTNREQFSTQVNLLCCSAEVGWWATFFWTCYYSIKLIFLTLVCFNFLWIWVWKSLRFFVLSINWLIFFSDSVCIAWVEEACECGYLLSDFFVDVGEWLLAFIWWVIFCVQGFLDLSGLMSEWYTFWVIFCCIKGDSCF